MNHLENDVPSFFEHLQNNMPREYAILTAVYHQKLLFKVSWKITIHLWILLKTKNYKSSEL